MPGHLTQEDLRVVDAIRRLNPQEEGARRTCLSRTEAAVLTVGSPVGRRVVCDLEVVGYGGKWARAVESQIRKGLDIQTYEFWLGARRVFLELGGPYEEDPRTPLDKV
ncbi:MAG: hypothetical protein M3315_06370 [Actinomycetota bacterium]|nr:hypothetical protein [Actinomycetota bacterium]